MQVLFQVEAYLPPDEYDGGDWEWCDIKRFDNELDAIDFIQQQLNDNEDDGNEYSIRKVYTNES